MAALSVLLVAALLHGPKSRQQGYQGCKPSLGRFLTCIAAVCTMWLLGSSHVWAQDDYLTYTGVWTTVPITGLVSPSDVTGDSNGKLYITDSTLTSVVTYAPDGTQSTLGSNLSAPEGITIDAAGDLYVASSGNNSVYKITPGGTQTTVGTGWNTPTSVAIDSTGNLFVTDNSGLSEVTALGAQSVLQSSAYFRGVAVDTSGNIYYGDNINDRVFEILAGTNTVSNHNFISFAQNLFVDAAGNVYMAETSTGVLRSDDNAAAATTFGDTLVTNGVWEDSHQHFYIADGSGQIEKVDVGPVDFGPVNVCPSGATVTPCSSTETLHFALDSEVGADVTMSVLTQGVTGLDYTISNDACTGTLAYGASCTVAVAFGPMQAGLRTGAAQAVGDSFYNNIARPVGPHPRIHTPVHPHDEPSNTLLSQVLFHGIGIAPLGVFTPSPIFTAGFTPLPGSYPTGIVFAPGGSYYVVDEMNCTVQKYSGNTTTVIAGSACGASSGDSGPATQAVFTGPWNIAIDGAGNLYISDYVASNVRKIDNRTGLISTIAGTGTAGYSGDGAAATLAELYGPTGVVVDAAGNLFICDDLNNVIRRVDGVTGIITTVAGNGTPGDTGDNGQATSATLNGPEDVALDSAGNLYISDRGNEVIRKVSGGIITTIAGTGTMGYSGDGGPATSAEIHHPEGIDVDPAGNVYIADASNRVVRFINVTSGVINTVAGVASATDTDTGEGGPATAAGLSYLEDVAIGPEGEIIVLDSDNSALREVASFFGETFFGTVSLGSSSAPQDVAFTNVGTSTLSVTALALPNEFTLGGADTTCSASTTLISNQRCILGIEFVPTADGPTPQSAFEFTDNEYNGPNQPQYIIVSGTGTGNAPAKLAFAGSIPSIAAGGNLGTVSVDIEDAESNLAAGATNTVTLTITGPGGYSRTLTVAAAGGVASFNLSSLPLATAGVYTLSATSATLTPAQATATVTGGNANTPAQLAFAGSFPTIPAGGNPGMVAVDVENSSGALQTSATNAVTLTLTGPGGYSQTFTVAATSGVAKFNLSSLALTAPGTYTLTATSNGLTRAVATINVTAGVTTGDPGVPVQLSIPASSVPPTVGSGGNLGIVMVDVVNYAGAVVTAANNTITVTVTGPGGYSQAITSVAVNGVASFNFSSLALTTPGIYTLTATSNGLTPAVTSSIVTAAEPTLPVQLSIPASAVPATLASGGNLGLVTVNVLNDAGTVVTTANNTITVTLTGPGGYSQTITSVAVNGVASFDFTSLALTAPGVYTLTASSGRLTEAIASFTVTTDFTIAVTTGSPASEGPLPPGVSTGFNFTLAPASGVFNSPIAITATGMPPGASYNFAPATVTPNGGPVTTQLTIAIPRSTAARLNRHELPRAGALGTLALGILLLPLSASRRMRSGLRRTPWMSVLLLLSALGAITGLAGCGAGGLFGQPQKSYTITVTGTSGSISHSATVTLTVE